MDHVVLFVTEAKVGLALLSSLPWHTTLLLNTSQVVHTALQLPLVLKDDSSPS